MNDEKTETQRGDGVSKVMQQVRKEYHHARLREENVPPDPLALFAHWLAEAIAAGLHEPNAMTVATAAADGRPSARTILLKDFDAQGFCFYTNYTSRKGQELAENPWATLLFWWGPLERQVRIEGSVAKVLPEESDAYYASRPLGARLGAWVSTQSQIIPNRAWLEERLAAVEAEYGEGQPPRPPHWGGYRVKPTAMEFWQGGPHRLHDRLVYRRTGDKPDDTGVWQIERLSP